MASIIPNPIPYVFKLGDWIAGLLLDWMDEI
jgi:hypothetical protein